MSDRLLVSISFFVFFIVVFTSGCFATITVSSITTTTSSCGNDGTATVNATSNKFDPFLAYEIIAGPSTAPVQTSPTFSSLYPGTYTARIYDVDFESVDRQFTVTGNYQLPSPNPIAYTPTCVGASDGMIIGNAAPLTGKPPLSWQIVSPYISAVQASDTFRNLHSGVYMIRVSDACGNFQSRTIFLVDDGTGFSNLSSASIIKMGCDTFALNISYSMLKQKAKFPVKLILTTSTGTVIKRVYPIPIDTVNFTPGIYTTIDTITGVDYGSYLKVCIEDTCGQRLCADNDTIAPYDFMMQYVTTLTCGNKMYAGIDLKKPPYFPYIYTAYKSPMKMTLTDVASNTVVDSMTCSYNYCIVQTTEHTSGRTYRLKMVDGCGRIFQKNIVWPSPGAPDVNVNIFPGCMDSTAYSYFEILNFRSNTKLDIISGPSQVKSTKPYYAFSDIVTYPKTFNVNGGSSFVLKNLSPGTYQYRVYDDCGNIKNGTFVVAPSDVADLNYSYSIKKGCLGNNIFTFNATSTSIVGIYMRDRNTNNVMYHKSYLFAPDSITSLPPGEYLFQIYYGYDPNVQYGYYYDASLTDHNQDCWLMQDTITIPYYSNNMFKASTTIFCNGNNYVQLLPDSTSGVPPYLYEIINGPQTFAPQASNLFNIPTYGNYTIRIQDACGNSNTQQISIDSSKFPPVVKRGPSCLGSKIILSGISSPFFQYEWRSPGGVIHHGDSLVINPLTAADTGVYLVRKTVTINGCTDSFNSSYHVYLHDVVIQTANLCHRTSVRVGNHVYTVPGFYVDSLINSKGCDSIVSTTVLVNYKRKSIDSTICEGNSVTVGVHAYTQTGIYKDTLIAVNGCDSMVTLNLTVIPYKRSSIHKTICQGLSFYFAGQTRSTAGVFYDTLATTGCDSIVTLYLSIEIPPMINLGADTSICEEPMHRLDAGPGFSVYYWNNNVIDTTRQTILVGTTGKYWVYIKTFAGCTATDTIEILTVYPIPVVSGGGDQYICSGTTTNLSATSPTGIFYQWTPGMETSASIAVSPSVTAFYKVTTTDVNKCVSHPDEVMVLVNPSPTTPPFGQPQKTYCFDNGPLMLSAQGEKYFLWTGGENTRSIEVKEEGVYSVTVSDDSGCFIKGEIFVKEYCAPELYFPSAFTPNGDNLHDDLEIFGKHFRNFEIKIFNRWGEIIFVSNDRNRRWDGTYRGEEMPSGTYECIVRYQGEYEEDIEAKFIKGSVTLIR